MAENTEQEPSAPVAEDPLSPAIANLGRVIATWIQELTGWRRLAADVARNGPATQTQLDSLFQSFLSEYRLSATEVAPAKPAQSTPPSDVSAPTQADSVVYRVSSVEHVSGVNKLPINTTLDLGPDTGLTIVYGPNAAGKSGFFRILKASCFTRTSDDQDILGDVWATEPVTQQAVVTLRTQRGTDRPVKWLQGDENSLLRERIAVFDATSVRAHLDEENSLVFAPSGLQVFAHLAGVYRGLKARLDTEVQRNCASLKLAPFDGQSRVSTLLENLGPDLSIEELNQLASFGEDEARELEALETQLNELNRTSPAEARARAVTRLNRLSAVKDTLERAESALVNEALTRVQSLRGDIRMLEQQADVATAAQSSSEPVQPVGSRTWLALIEAAARFAAEAFPDVPYPSGRESGRCVLCQQVLAPDAVARMKRFWATTDARVRRDAAARKSELQALIGSLGQLDLSPIGPDSASLAELDSSASIRAALVGTHYQLEKRKQWIISEGGGDAPPLLDSSTVKKAVEALVAETHGAIDRLSADNSQQIVASLKQRRTLLLHRRYLATVIVDVREAVQRQRWVAAAKKAGGHLKTTELSVKQRALTAELLKANYANRLSTECKELGFALPVELQLSGLEGQAVRAVRLSGTEGRTSPTRVLSEGEQRALALADFLTEAAVASEFDCLVFDDPVTSHDHERKGRVADRLARESKHRQVVIFTHDRVFVAYLIAAVKTHSLSVSCRTIGRRALDNAPGYPGVSLFPEPSYERQALNEAERLLREARQLTGSELHDKVLAGFGRLRTANEEFIQSDIFGGVVNRWVEQIKWMNLKDLFFDGDTVRAVQAHLEALSRYIEGHSHSDGFQEAAPNAADLEREIATHKSITQAFRTKKKAYVASAPRSQLK